MLYCHIGVCWRIHRHWYGHFSRPPPASLASWARGPAGHPRTSCRSPSTWAPWTPSTGSTPTCTFCPKAQLSPLLFVSPSFSSLRPHRARPLSSPRAPRNFPPCRSPIPPRPPRCPRVLPSSSLFRASFPFSRCTLLPFLFFLTVPLPPPSLFPSSFCPREVSFDRGLVPQRSRGQYHP